MSVEASRVIQWSVVAYGMRNPVATIRRLTAGLLRGSRMEFSRAHVSHQDLLVSLFWTVIHRGWQL
jgi:hypothetical protein